MTTISNTIKPAILGSNPMFTEGLHLTVPDIPSWESVKDRVEELFNSGWLTKGPYLNELETNMAKFIGTKYAVGLSSCTSGLMLIYKLLELKGEVILPSFTFMATGQALMWMKDITPIFVDIDPDTFNIDPKKVEEAITPNTSAIVGVHIYGNPANVEALEAIAKKHNLKLIFDSAHGLGSLYKGQRLGGFGDAESFSCSPTKLLITGEGGIVTTNNDKLAEGLKLGREYGNPGNYDSLFAGMNARMGEFNALMGIESLKMLDNVVKKRNEFAQYMITRLSKLPGVRFQKINKDDVSSYKDFTIVIEDGFELTRDQLVDALKAENIDTRNYYSPPLHLQTTYKKYKEQYEGKLPVTEKLCNTAVTLPLSSKFTQAEIEKLCEAIENIYKYRDEIKKL